EQMLYGLLVEAVFGLLALAGKQLEAVPGCKGQHKAHALAAGTVAGDGVLQVHVDFIEYCAALAATFVVGRCHVIPPAIEKFADRYALAATPSSRRCLLFGMRS